MPPDAKTKFYVLVGRPVDHSFSPALYNAAFDDLKINSVYLACPVEENRLKAALEGMRALGVAGANVTSPYKEAVIPFLDSLSPQAGFSRSVNTIINRDGHLQGETTDGEGFYCALPADTAKFETEREILFVGAGGAVRAVAYVMARNTPLNFTFINRSSDNGLALSKLIAEQFPAKKSVYLPLNEMDIITALRKCRLVIYGLPLDDHEFIAAISKDKALIEGKKLFDLRYHPKRTPVMEVFEKQGGLACNGLEMLLQQAALSFELFTGQKAPLDIMRRAAREAGYGNF